VAEQAGLSFAGLLRRLRSEAKLTQEELAEAASLSPRSVSDLERGINRTTRKDTAVLLAEALGLAEPVRALFVAAARGKTPAADVLAASEREAPGASPAAATRSLPRAIAAFTGRQAELSRLLGALAAAGAGPGVVGIYAIDGMAGIGKTTFAVHAAHRLAEGFPDGQFFLPLHAHTPGQRPVEPADALAGLLVTAGITAPHIPPGLEARAARWRDLMAGKKILLLLDDAAGHEQVRPLLPGTAGGLVLITSRRRLTALEDAAVISLDTLSPAEAAALLARLAARPGIRAGDAAVGDLTRLCGYLPLAIGMLASQLRHHPARGAAELAADLAAASDRLAVMRAENVSVAAAFDLSYRDLTPDAQRLFRRLGLVPGPGVDAYAAAALDGTGLAAARGRLDELYDQHLITEPVPGRYQLHDLLRRHARALAAADPADRDAAAGRLLDYYLYTVLAASRHFESWAGYSRPPPGRPPADVPGLSTFEQATAWLEAELPNLHAAADYAAASGRHLHAIGIPAAMSDFFLARGPWDQASALHRTALGAARRAGNRSGQAIAHRELGHLAWQIGDYPAAAANLAEALAHYRDVGDRAAQALVLNQLGHVQILTGDYPAAHANHQQALTLVRSAGDRIAEGDVLTHMGFAQQLTGDYPASEAYLADALALSRSLGRRQVEAQALNNLGTLHTLTGDHAAAATEIEQALAMFRDGGNRLAQAWALNDLGSVHTLTGDYAAAATEIEQALAMFRDFGHRLGQAEALNRLGELCTRTAATAQARERHTAALAIARDIGVPFEQARALEGLGRAYLHDGDRGEAAAYLGRALVIYQRIGAQAAQRVEETLDQHGLTVSTAEAGPTPAGDGPASPPPAAPSASW
jgi:tetratricopeptide (TPR) repeat protein/transcriptional regulator with XRE-family HTH domain